MKDRNYYNEESHGNGHEARNPNSIMMYGVSRGIKRGMQQEMITALTLGII